MKSNRLRLVLKETVTGKAVNAAAWDNHWLLYDVTQRSSVHPYEKIWTTADEKTSIHYIEDFEIEVNYLLIHGPEVEKMAQQAKASLAIYTTEEIASMAQAAQRRTEQIRAVYYAAVSATPGAPSTLLDVIESAAANPDLEVRHAAIVAVAYTTWSGGQHLLERLAKTDPEESVRHDAALMLEALANQTEEDGATK